MKHLRRILEDIDKSLQFSIPLQNEKFLIQQLKHLESIFEKMLIRKRFLSHEWNAGSVRMFGILKPLHLANITDYLLELSDTNKVFYVLNDLLESDFSLISEIISDDSATEILHEPLSLCYRSFINDAINNPESIKINFLEHIPDYLNQKQMQKVKFEILDVILAAQEDEMLEMVIRQQKDWNSTYQEDKMIIKILKTIVDSPLSTLEHLLVKTNSSSFNGWIFFLQTLKLILESDLLEDEIIALLKSFQKKQFSVFLQTSNERQFLIFLLVARQLSYYAPQHFGDYSKWYKSIIGDMVYCKVEKTEFITVLQFLTKLTPFESDLDILEVHSKIVIHPLPFTNNFVLEFKQMTRNQLEYIKEGKESSAETTKIEIDDSLKTLIVDLTLEEDEEMQELK